MGNSVSLSEWNPNDTYLFAVLGSNPRYCDKRKKVYEAQKTDENSTKVKIEKEYTYKYVNFYMTSHGVLLKRLARYYGIPNENVHIFAKGTKEQFFVQDLTGNKLYLQLNLQEIYEASPSSEDIDFEYFDRDIINKIFLNIQSTLTSNHNSRILFFLDDQSLRNEFSYIPSLQFYIPFLMSPHLSLRIFNDSCYSEKMIDIIKRFWILSDVIKKATNGKGMDVKIIKTISKLASDYDEFQQLESIRHIILKIEQILSCNKPYGHDIKLKINLINNAIKALPQLTLSKGDNRPLPFFTENDKYPKINANYLKQMGILTFSDLFDFQKVINRINISYGFGRFTNIELLNMKNFDIAVWLSKKLNCRTSADLYSMIDEMCIQEIEAICDKPVGKFLPPVHDDHVIITTASYNGLSVKCGARKVEGTDRKVIMGTPGFGAFIDEIFLNVTNEPINIENIKKSTSYEFAAVCPERKGEKILKQWIGLEINKFETQNISNERLFSKELIENPPTRREIMEDIGFHLVQEFESDGETPVDPTNRLFVETKHRKRVRSRRSSDNKEKKKEMSSYLIHYETEIDEYYSDEDFYEGEGYAKSNITSASESEGETERKKFSEFTEEDADKIIKSLDLPHYGWRLDMYDFIVMALKKKTKRMEFPFNPTKEGKLDGSKFLWAHQCLKKHIPSHELCNATKLINMISDFACENGFLCESLDEPLAKLIMSICKIGNEKLPMIET